MDQFAYAIKGMLMIPELSVFDDYEWVANILDNNMSNVERLTYIEVLRDFFRKLKHYGLRNSTPKSNVLITIHILDNTTQIDAGRLICDNSKYLEYCEYLIANAKDRDALYRQFIEAIEKYVPKCRMNIPLIINSFAFMNADDFDVENIDKYRAKFWDSKFWDFVLNNNVDSMKELIESCGDLRQHYIDDAFKKVKNISALVELYKMTGMVDECYTLLHERHEDFQLIKNSKWFAEKYGEELYDYFCEKFYEKLKEGKNRNVYREAARYVRGIKNLDETERSVKKFMLYLDASEYANCPALYDEIATALAQR